MLHFFFLFFYLVFVVLFLGVLGGCSLVFDFMLGDLCGLSFSFSLVFDFVSVGFFAAVSFISSLVFFYGGFYMDGSVNYRRYMWLVMGFVLSMGVLVFSGGFFFVMVGWDGLGVISFCLVIFYHNSGSLESGLLTVFSNRVGDVFFLGSFFFFFLGGTFWGGVFMGWGGFVLSFFLFVGAITKSAQLPFSAWLPAAMAAPTPVSSLVHSSTLVTAGVYVLVRFMGVFWGGLSVLKVFFLGTMVLAGFCAVLEGDFKKVIAMSTLSQLGFMLFVLSLGLWILSFMHVVIHAFFKSMLFLGGGSLISHLGGGQDSRYYGGLSVSFFSFLFFFVSFFCLGGFPFFVGFYSKDCIIVGESFVLGCFYYFLFIMGCFFTVLYSFRLLLSSFGGFWGWGSVLSVGESYGFSFSVIFLFLKCWVLGGLFWWGFLLDGLIYVGGLDFVGGLLIFFFGLLYLGVSDWGSIRLGGVMGVFGGIGFMRWFSTGSFSFAFCGNSSFKWEGGWLEVFGGQGVYNLWWGCALFFDLVVGLVIGLIFLGVCIFWFFFF